MTGPLDPIVVELAAERRRQGLSQRAVARAIGSSNASVWVWESGASSPSLDHVRTWAEVLGYELTLEEGLL